MRYLRQVKELNQVEQWKLERHPLDVRDAVVDRYAREGPEAIKTVPGEVERLKWVGLYPQRQGGDAFMLRIKIPGGRLSAAQARVIGEVAGGKPDEPKLINTCYSLVAPDYGISVTDVYQVTKDKGITTTPNAGGLSVRTPTDLGERKLEAAYARGWYRNISADSWG
jgi:hypothetical protein